MIFAGTLVSRTLREDKMNSLILHPTDMSQWHALVNEAQAATQLVLNEQTESYLVFLLMRYTQTPKLLDSILAIDLLESLQKKGIQQRDRLQEVGDKSLLFCGLFPGIAQKRHVKLTYFSAMGQAAYLTISERYPNHMAALYEQLSEQFIQLQQVLQAMRIGRAWRLGQEQTSYCHYDLLQ